MASQDSKSFDLAALTEPRLTGVRGWALALCCIALAFAVRLLMDPIWGAHLPYITFFLAMLFIMRFGSPGQVAVSSAAGVLLGKWFFIAPRHSWSIEDPVYRVNALFFILTGLGLVLFSVYKQRAQARERAAHEQLMRATRELARLGAIVESSDDAIVGKDLSGKILSWNSGAQRLYGYTPDEIIGKSIEVLHPAESASETAGVLERVRNGESIHGFETTRRTKDGRLVPVSLTISPVRDSAGAVIGYSAIGGDISERKRAENERERLVRDLQAALAKVKTLTGLLPICSGCKKIRDDKGDWNQIEHYIRDRSMASFTHGICPDCAEHYYGDVLRAAPKA